METQRQVRTRLSTRHRIQQPEQPKERLNDRQLRVVAIDFFGKKYTKNQTAVFEIKCLVISKHSDLGKLGRKKPNKKQ